MQSGRHGFTLVEALIVVVIAGALLLMSLPRLDRALARREVTNARAAVATLVLRARTAAVQRRQPVRVAVDSATAWISAETASGPVLLSSLPLRESFGIVASASADGFTVQPNGLVIGGTPFTVWLARGGITDSVRITGYGRVQ